MAELDRVLPDRYDPRRRVELNRLLAEHGSDPITGIAARRYLRRAATSRLGSGF
jgi:hypothetical protein